jgi:hypothetical protein
MIWIISVGKAGSKRVAGITCGEVIFLFDNPSQGNIMASDRKEDRKFFYSINRRRAMAKEEKKEEEKKGLFGRFGKAAKELIYGMAAHDTARFALKTRGSMEHLFILITMGDLLGVPILPPYYSLRILPYVVPQISTWKRRMLRERDLTDALA